MTDRINAFVVVLEQDLRKDDAQSTLDAIKHIKGVLTVESHISDIENIVAYSRVRQELGAKLWDVLYGKKP